MAIQQALLLRDRVRHIDFRLPPSILSNFLMSVDGPPSILEKHSLSSTSKEDTNSILHSCSKPTPLNARRHRSSRKRGCSLLSLSLHSCSRTPDLLLVSPHAISNPSSVTSPNRGTVHRLLRHRAHPSAERELLTKRGGPIMLPNRKRLAHIWNTLSLKLGLLV